MRVPGIKTAGMVTRRLVGRLRGAALVLGYHRVSPSSWDPFGIGVESRRFAEQMEVLASIARPLPLEELLDARHVRRLRERAVAVTFDDAYSECLSEVAPVLERHGVPATVFAISGALGEEPWWERLARMLSPARALESPIELDGRRFGSERRSEAAAATRGVLVREVHGFLALSAPEKRRLLLDRLAESVGIAADAAPDHRVLTPEELLALARRDLVSVGAHGHRHLELGGLSDADRRLEVETSKRVLEEILEQPVVGFSYPHGSVDARSRDEVRHAGFRYACGSRPGPLLPSSDGFSVPRVWAPDVGGHGFRGWLQGWLGP